MEPMDSSNAWVMRVATAQRRLPALLAIFLAVALLVLVLVPVRSWVLSLAPLTGGSPVVTSALKLAILYASIFLPLYLCAIVSMRLWERRAQLHGALNRGEAALMGALVGLAGFVAALLISLVAGHLQLETPFSMPGLGTLIGVVLGALLLAFQSGAEEYFFRGWLQPLVAADWGPWAGLILTSFIFAVAHAFVNVHGATGFINLFLAGTVFGLLALRTGSVWAAFAAHWLWNWLEQSVVGLTPNPGIDPLGSIVDLKLVGSALAGAGRDELNGALAVTLVMGLLIVLLALIPSARTTSPERGAHRSGRVPDGTP